MSDQICDLMTRDNLRWKWITLPSGERVYDVSLSRCDGRATVSFRGQDESLHQTILNHLQGILQRDRQRRSDIAKRAAETRARRTENKTRYYADAYLRGLFGLSAETPAFQPTAECRICGKKIRDSESKSRGIGPECWSNVLQVAECMAKIKAEAKAT